MVKEYTIPKIMERKRGWFILSLILLAPGLVSLGIWRLRVGLDFKGGSLSEYRVVAQDGVSLPDEIELHDLIRKTYESEGLADPRIQAAAGSGSERRVVVRTLSLASDTHINIVRRLKQSDPPIEELSFASTDPQVGSDTTRKALWAIGLASLAIIIYLAVSFRGVPPPLSSWQFGIFAVVALLHDVAFILGFYSLMGHFALWEVNTEFVTAALTVMGFSVHDTIVVFDRVRENLKRYPSHNFTAVVNASVAQTMSRSINTSLTVLLPLLAVVLLGGRSLRSFALVLLVGIAIGTYSSIFVATALLDWWQGATQSDFLARFRVVGRVRRPKNSA